MSEEAGRTRRARKAWMIAVAAVLVLAAFAGLAVLFRAMAYGSWVADNGGCATRWPGNSQGWPYGDVRSCRQLDHESHLFGDVDVTSFVLLETAAGEVALKVDYSDTDRGRQYVSRATELGADSAPRLSSAERRSLEQAIAGRGGVRAQPLTLHYGDG